MASYVACVRAHYSVVTAGVVVRFLCNPLLWVCNYDPLCLEIVRSLDEIHCDQSAVCASSVQLSGAACNAAYTRVALSITIRTPSDVAQQAQHFLIE